MTAVRRQDCWLIPVPIAAMMNSDANVRRGQQVAGSKEPEKPPVPAAEKPPECKSMMSDLEQVEACRLRMLWMSERGNNVQDIADSLRYKPPQSVEEQGMLECVRTMQTQEKLEADLLAQARAEAGARE